MSSRIGDKLYQVRPAERHRLTKGEGTMEEAAKDRGTVEQALIRKSLQDESFRGRLLADPKGTIEQELGRKLPADLEVQVLEETEDSIYLVLPPARAIGELSDAELDAVAGGKTDRYDG